MPSDTPPSTHREVHVWRIRAECASAPVDAIRACLDEAEAVRADTHRFTRDRDRFIVFRGALRQVLGHYLGLSASEVRLATGARGKPSLATIAGPPQLHFNLAHCDDLALLAICTHGPVGVDVEAQRPIRDADRLAARFFSPDERLVYDTLPPEDKVLAFLRCWTRKEAYAKALGDGLSLPFDRFTVSFAPGDDARLLAVDDRPGEADRWTLHDLGPAAGGVGAIAVQGRAAIVRWFDWPSDIPISLSLDPRQSPTRPCS